MTFLRIFSCLYESEASSDMAKMTSLLQNLDIPIVDPLIANGLDAPLSLEEIMRSIKVMQNKKNTWPR